MIRIPPMLFPLLLIALVTPIKAAEQPDTGKDLYTTMCASCHGADLRGGRAPNLLTEQWTDAENRAALFALASDGLLEAGMPPFKNNFSDEQIDQVVDYIVSLEPAAGVEDEEAFPRLLDTLDYAVDVEIFVEALTVPWAIDFIDADTALITERSGQLRIVKNGRLLNDPVAGTPETSAVLPEEQQGQGGLLDVTVDPDYEDNGWIYLAYSHVLEQKSEAGNHRSMTRAVRGRIRGNQWVDEQVVFEAPHNTYADSLPYHYGTRVVLDAQRYLYLSIGERVIPPEAQDLTQPNGKVHRLKADGSIPEDNPFVDAHVNVEGALPSIFTYGHRNPQGLAVHPITDAIWAAEHGSQGGDELNRLIAGGNYGWPRITYGVDYDGSIITPHRRLPGMEQPALYWRPSIAVSGITFYTGERFPLWQNKLLTGALKDEELRLLDIDKGRVMHQEVILKGAGRVREAAVGPDGAIYVVLNEPGRVLRLTPREERRK